MNEPIFKMLVIFLLISCGKTVVVPIPTPIPVPAPEAPKPAPPPSPAPSIMPLAASLAIKEACESHKEVALGVNECLLVLTGASLKESGWNVNSPCQAWGSEVDPACGLTQSRKSDAVAVGLSCDPTLQTPEGYKCNALTGLYNLRCKADKGVSCDRYGQGRSLYLGVKKHLGLNESALPEYISTMEQVYNSSQIRLSFSITVVKPWVVILLENQ